LRRPLPALIALLALLLLTALVWWRVLNRDSGSAASSNCPTPSAPAAQLPGPNRVTVQVLNATSRNGIAGKARARLVADGFNSPRPAGNDKPKVKIRGVAQIRFGPRGRNGATLLHYYFPGARLVPSKSKSAIVVVSLGEKYRGIASASAVTATLHRRNIQLNTAAPGAPRPSPTC
jgi:hypothetical protein